MVFHSCEVHVPAREVRRTLEVRGFSALSSPRVSTVCVLSPLLMAHRNKDYIRSLCVTSLFLFWLPVPPNTTTVQTKHDDIAHFTCTTHSQATISWKMGTRYLSENDFGVTILLCNDSASLKSHLFVAVTNDALRGKYECFSSDEPDMAMETFFIESKE